MPLRGRAHHTALAVLLVVTSIASAESSEAPRATPCPTLTDGTGSGPAQDAAPVSVHEGMLVRYPDILRLGSLLPIEIWRNRDAFFHEGMELEIGSCRRDYPVPSFFREATTRLAGTARLDDAGNLRGHVAGLPFPPETIDAEAPDAGLRWAWNVARRYRGAGPDGSFRIVDMPSRIGGIQTYRGRWFFVQTSHRADLASSDYGLSFARNIAWVAGGRFDEPSSARHLAWKQSRPLDVATRYNTADDIFVYVPTMRKVRRAGSSWVDGMYVPRYRVGGEGSGGGLSAGGGQFGPGAAINPSAGESIAITENLRRGFEGLTLRPNAYRWRVLAERDVLAPLNVTRVGYPEDPDRNWGPSGLSAGNDRWDVRRAIVIQGALREPGRDYDLLTLYIDMQTQQPLYVMSRRRRGGQLLEVGVLLYRFSGDVRGYPKWPNGEKANVFDPVAAVFFEVTDGGSGWRREAYDILSVPRSKAEVMKMISASDLSRGH